jgi:hypothetical protein
MLMPASAEPKKDREIIVKILTMDNDGAFQRWTRLPRHPLRALALE